jgi:hypothetical protein
VPQIAMQSLMRHWSTDCAAPVPPACASFLSRTCGGQEGSSDCLGCLQAHRAAITAANCTMNSAKHWCDGWHTEDERTSGSKEATEGARLRSGPFGDLCDGVGTGLTQDYPFDNTTYPVAASQAVRQAYW